MQPLVKDDDFVVESATQTPEAIQAVLEGDGFQVVETTHRTVASADPPAPAAEPPVVPVVPVVAPVEPEKPAEQPKTDEGKSPEAPPAEPAGDKTRLSGHQRDKLKLQRATDENAELKRRLDEMEKRFPKAEPAPAPVEVDKPDPEPNFEDEEKYPDGAFDAKFRRDFAKWAARETLREERAAEKASKAEIAQRQTEEHRATDKQQREARTAELIAAAKTEHADYDAVMEAGAQTPVTPAMAYIINAAEIGYPKLAYYLATHAEEAARIFEATKLNEDASQAQINRAIARAQMEIDKIEEQLQSGAPAATAAAPAAKVPPATQAPAASEPPKKTVPVKPTPVEPVGARVASTRKRLSEMSDQETAELDSAEYIRLYKDEYGRTP